MRAVGTMYRGGWSSAVRVLNMPIFKNRVNFNNVVVVLPETHSLHAVLE